MARRKSRKPPTREYIKEARMHLAQEGLRVDWNRHKPWRQATAERRGFSTSSDYRAACLKGLKDNAPAFYAWRRERNAAIQARRQQIEALAKEHGISFNAARFRLPKQKRLEKPRPREGPQ